MLRHTFSGVAGIEISVTPNGSRALMMALINAGGDAIAPATTAFHAKIIMGASGYCVFHLE